MASLRAPASLRRLLHPASIAIVGASPRPGAFGERVLRNLHAYRGHVHLVNARHREIGGRPCLPRLADLPEAPDCVVLAVPREAVEPLLAECAACGAGGLIVFASGYAETGTPEHVAAEARLAAFARSSGLPLLGPNCIGIANYLLGAGITFSAMPEPAERVGEQAIGIASQSGALGFALSQAIERGVAVSHVLTSGNSCDVDMADCVAYLAAEPACRAIACMFEGMAEPARMVAAAAYCRAACKALVVHKMARGAEGARAARSHTGALAGDEAAWQAVLTHAGAIVVEGHESLIETARFFAKAPAPRAGGVAVLATSGGAGIMAADAAEQLGIKLPQPGPATAAVLAARVPEFGAARNPCDVTAQVLNDPQSFAACAEALLADPAYAALVVPHVMAYEPAIPRIRLFEEIAARHSKLICIPWLTEWLEGPGVKEAEQAPHTVLFRSMRRCFTAIAAWQERAEADVRTQAPSIGASARRAAAACLDAAAEPMLVEREAKAALAFYGVPVSEDRLVRSSAEAAATAAALGFPVAIKVESPDLPHKTEAGAIRLGLGSAQAVRKAYSEVLANVRAAAPAARIAGVLVSRMVPAGVELIVGARLDPRFGPLLLVGFGGVLAELLADRVLAPAPARPAEALRLISKLKGQLLLDGYRGAPPVDRVQLCEVISRISLFAADQAERLVSLDVNPLICGPGGIVAVDALIERRTETAPRPPA